MEVELAAIDGECRTERPNASKGSSDFFAPQHSLRHPGVWALIFVHCCLNCAQYTVMSWGPTYCTDVLKMPLRLVGLALACPVVAVAAGAWLGGSLMDSMICGGSTVISTRRRVMVLALV